LSRVWLSRERTSSASLAPLRSINVTEDPPAKPLQETGRGDSVRLKPPVNTNLVVSAGENSRCACPGKGRPRLERRERTTRRSPLAEIFTDAEKKLPRLCIGRNRLPTISSRPCDEGRRQKAGFCRLRWRLAALGRR